MTTALSFAFLWLLTYVSAITQQQQPFHPSTIKSNAFYQYDISGIVNNHGLGEGSDFDGLKSGLTCPKDASNRITVGTIPFHVPNKDGKDNALSQGQVLSLEHKQLGGLYLLVSVSHGPLQAHVVVSYDDGDQDVTTLEVPDWQVDHPHQLWHDNVVCEASTGARANLIALPVHVDPQRTVSHLSLPYTNWLGSFRPILHIFGVTGLLAPSHLDQSLQIVSARPRGKSILAVRLHNTGTTWLDDIVVLAAGRLIETKEAGTRTWLAPGEVAVVEVEYHSLLKESTSVAVTIHAATTTSCAEHTLDVSVSRTQNINDHYSPAWYRESKFGIFFHWGVYSVPSWAPPNQYAEWWWWNQNQQGSPTWHYSRRLFGDEFEYDQFIDHWDPSEFDPSAWLDLVRDAQARYFVLTTKHHDGVALFDTKVNERSTVHFKGRDFVEELMTTAEQQYPELKRGLYFSMPEWYHPLYRDDSLGWHGPPRNAYSHQQVAYHGVDTQAIHSFVDDVQTPQALELIRNYDPDIFWCDIGGINDAGTWQKKFFNGHKQVVVNDRCGNGISDFSTIEYRSVGVSPARMWESTRGVDPYSFGYNRATSPEKYTSVKDLLHELVSVVARGGNFLLNVGPEASGRIPAVMAERVRGMGAWLHVNGEALFDTEPYWAAFQDKAEPSQPLVFTRKKDGGAFYIISLERPGPRLVVKAPVYNFFGPDATVRLLGASQILPWTRFSNGRLAVEVPRAVADQGEHVWIFKVEHTP